MLQVLKKVLFLQCSFLIKKHFSTTIEILEEDGVFDIGPSVLSTNSETCAFELFPGTILISGGAVDQVFCINKCFLKNIL